MATARIFVTLKKGILDPQGKAVEHALQGLGIDAVKGVRVGKLISLTFEDVSETEARRLSDEACEKLLANPVIEDYEVELLQAVE